MDASGFSHKAMQKRFFGIVQAFCVKIYYVVCLGLENSGFCRIGGIPSRVRCFDESLDISAEPLGLKGSGKPDCIVSISALKAVHINKIKAAAVIFFIN